MKWETRFVRRLLLVMYAIDLFRRCALFGRAWQLPCWDGVDVLGSCHCRCSHDLNRHPANAKLRMGWLDCREAKKCFAAKQPILSNVGRLIIKLSPPKFLKIFLFFRGGQHSNSKFLEPYGWDHDMYLIDSPWFCWVFDGFWMDLALKRVLLYFAFSKHLKTKPGEAQLEFIIAMPGAGLLLLFWGLQRGYPLWTCFLVVFNKGFIRKSAVW